MFSIDWIAVLVGFVSYFVIKVIYKLVTYKKTQKEKHLQKMRQIWARQIEQIPELKGSIYIKLADEDEFRKLL